MKKNAVIDWIMRVIKGMFIGTGFVLPGVSGGALAAVFGIYERLISFIAHLTKDFWKNIMFFIPVGVGAVLSIVLSSFFMSFVFETYEIQILWFFVGCILGIVPSLWKEAGKKGREGKHTVILLASFVFGCALLFGIEKLSGGSTPLNFGTWVVAGALIALGILVPGLSPSNFLVFMGMYKPMTDGFKALDMSVIIPLGIGGLACVLILSKVVDAIFKKAYTGLYHFILGIVFASTVMIIPRQYAGMETFGFVACGVMCLLGAALGFFMSRLEGKYKPED